MTAHKRSGHGIFKARDIKNGKQNTDALGPGILGQPTSASAPASGPSPPTPPTASSASSSPPTANTSAATASSTSPSSAASSSVTSKSTSASVSTTVSSTSATTKAPLTTAIPPTYSIPTNTGTYSYPALTTSAAPSTTSSSSSSVGGMSVGAIVGIVGGGLFGALILLMLGSYLLRWWRRHSAEHDFVDEYNEPAPDFSPSRSNSLRDPPMSQPASAASYGTSAGMAGQGIMATRAAMRTPGYGGGYAGYQNDDESFSGAYSSQPQPQAPYNPEAYGSYVPYGNGGGAGYQEAVRGYQGQRAFEAPVNIGYAISEPPFPQAAYPTQSSPPPAPAPSNSPPPRRSISPTTGAPRTTASAALAAAKVAAAVPVYKSPLDDQSRQTSTYSEQDAYGGF